MSISIGPVTTRNAVFLAPMSGVTDEPFREIAHAMGAGLVITEMVAGEELARQRRDMVRRARGAGKLRPFVIQLAGREARWMAEGARLAEGLGADIIDINMGCPAREVTGGLSGSALMREPDLALRLIAATVQATSRPVTLKMRLGWDDQNRNAPEIAARAEEAGVRMITVHGRTRQQFYKGRADWPAIARVRAAIKIPLIANGDCRDAADARAMMAQSGADGVMIGRAACGRPWWPGVVAEALNPGSGMPEPTLEQEHALIRRQHRLILDCYGPKLGNRHARKHLGWTLDRLTERNLVSAAAAPELRRTLLTEADNAAVAAHIDDLYGRAAATRRAA
jgi:nifR3 family TIM-barrel protein